MVGDGFDAAVEGGFGVPWGRSYAAGDEAVGHLDGVGPVCGEGWKGPKTS